MEKRKEHIIKLNVDYIKFVSEMKTKKLLESNPEKLKNLYEEHMNLFSHNCSRVINRTMRKELREVLSQCLTENNLSFEEYKKFSEKLTDNTSNNNYLKVIVKRN